MAQRMQGLLHKREDVGLDLTTHVKAGSTGSRSNFISAIQREADPGGLLTSQQSKQQALGPVKGHV